MTTIIGELAMVDGEPCIKMKFSPENPEIYDVPLSELLEDYIGKRVKIDIMRIGSWEDLK